MRGKASEGPAHSTEPSTAKTFVLTAISSFVGTFIASLLGPLTMIQIAAGVAAGALVGYLVRSTALKRGEARLGSTAMIACTTSGAVLGLILAVPVGLVFYIVLRRRGERSLPAAAPTP